MSKIKAFFKRLFTLEDEKTALPGKDPPDAVSTPIEEDVTPASKQVPVESTRGSRFIPPGIRR